jgi:hypothetical protein
MGGFFLLAMKKTKAMWMVNLLSLTIVMSIGCMLLWLMIVFKNGYEGGGRAKLYWCLHGKKLGDSGALRFLMSLEILQDHDPT